MILESYSDYILIVANELTTTSLAMIDSNEYTPAIVDLEFSTLLEIASIIVFDCYYYKVGRLKLIRRVFKVILS